MPRITLERLAFGGDAVGHLDGKAVFVPLGAPGDVADVDIDIDRERWSRGRVSRLEHPGPDRVTPRCRHFGHCGGCQWQHLTLEAQHAAKRAIVEEQLQRIGRLEDPPVAPVQVGSDWGYRERVTLAREGDVLGFRESRSHALVEIEVCPITSDPVVTRVPAAGALARAFGERIRRVTVVANGDAVVLVAVGGRPSRALARQVRPTLGGGVSGIVWRGAGRRLAVGRVAVRRLLEPGLDLVAPADVFTQASGWAHTALVDTVRELAPDTAGLGVLDLYCGAGTLGLPLARRGARVHGIERDPLAADAARSNARRLALADFTVATGNVATQLGDAPPADLVVLDPPRRGAADAIGPLLARRPPAIVYVSCDPATFARDAGRLVRGGYRLTSVRLLDVFPQTYHVEVVAGFRLT